MGLKTNSVAHDRSPCFRQTQAILVHANAHAQRPLPYPNGKDRGHSRPPPHPDWTTSEPRPLLVTRGIPPGVPGVYMHDFDHGHTHEPGLQFGRPVRASKFGLVVTHFDSQLPKPTGIPIWEVGWITVTTHTEAETVSIPEDATKMFAFQPRKQHDIVRTGFHPASCQLTLIRTRTGYVSWSVTGSHTSCSISYHTASTGLSIFD